MEEERRKKVAQNAETTNSNLCCMPMESGLSYGPGIAPAHSNIMSLAVLNKMALWWVGGVSIYNIPLAARHTTTYALIHGQEMSTSRGTSCKQPLNYNSQQVKTSGNWY